jgi:hypothetical protein
VKWNAWVVSDQHGKFVCNDLAPRVPCFWTKTEAHNLARDMTMEAASGHPGYRSKKLRYIALRATVTSTEGTK